MNDRHPLVERLAAATGGCEVTPEGIEAFESCPGNAVLFFGGDPVRFPEALDVAVVLPELHACCGGFQVGIVPRSAEDALARRYAVQRWPALVFLRDGGFLGTVSGMKDWVDYVTEVQATLAAAPGPRPAPTIAIHAAAGCP